MRADLVERLTVLAATAAAEYWMTGVADVAFGEVLVEGPARLGDSITLLDTLAAY